jgi:hypothetical protein
MPYHLKLPNGANASCDTPEEYRQLLKLYEELLPPSARRAAIRAGPLLTEIDAERAELEWHREQLADDQASEEREPVTAEQFVRVLNPKQREALRVIRARKEITLDQLTEALGQENNQATGGIMSGVTKLAATFEFDLTRLFRKKSSPGSPDPRKGVTRYLSQIVLHDLDESVLLDPPKEAKK